ncbi:MAG: tetratricopeptide repeat protein [Acidobacteriota bacterium]
MPALHPTRRFAACLGLLLASCGPGRVPPSPTPATAPAPDAVLDRALALFQDEEPSFDPARTRARIDALTRRARGHLAGIEDPRLRVERLNRFFFDEEGFTADLDLRDPANLFPDRVLRRRRGYCTGLALIYLGIAEGLGLPIHGVNTPEHVLLRYRDETHRINIELLAEGRDIPDEHYRERDRIDPRSEAAGVFLADLDADRFLSQIVNNLGTLETRKGHGPRAERLYTTAIQLDPRNPTAFYNLGRQWMAEDRCADAIRVLGKALDLNPNDVPSLNNRGVCRARLGDPDGAAADFLAALAIDPGSESARRNLERLNDPEP